MPAPGKKFSKTYKDSKTGRTRHVSYGAKGYKIKPGTSAGDSYCARSYGISKKAGYDCSGKDRNKPNCLSRKKWHCKGKKSVKESVDDLITDMLAVSFHAEPGGEVKMEPVDKEGSRQDQIARQILQLAQELLALSGSDQVLTSAEFENIGEDQTEFTDPIRGDQELELALSGNMLDNPDMDPLRKLIGFEFTFDYDGRNYSITRITRTTYGTDTTYNLHLSREFPVVVTENPYRRGAKMKVVYTPYGDESIIRKLSKACGVKLSWTEAGMQGKNWMSVEKSKW